MIRSGLRPEEQAEVWRRYRTGESMRSISRTLDRSLKAVRRLISARGGRPPRPRPPSARRLSLAEREEILRGVAAGDSCRRIAGRLGRAPSTISREIGRNGGRRHYRASRAEAAAHRRGRRPKTPKLAQRCGLRRLVEDQLALRWSPQQIARWLPGTYPNDPEWRVSHETIYLSLFVQPRGTLRKQLTRYLRTQRKVGRPRAPDAPGQGQLRDAVYISERPAEVADRAVPGHWEGDLLLGRGNSGIATLVERTTRFVILIRLPHGRSSEAVLDALAARIRTLPHQLLRSLTWDQGKEMARHAQFTIDTGVQIYICDPRSPWQRGTNENTNGLLRDYFPKGTDFKPITQARLDAVAAELNERPRQTLGWVPPSEKFAEAVALTP
jgi:IS30 family transposase